MLHCDFLVIGGGPTGIGAAIRLAELDEDYLLVEASDHVGGMATSVTDPEGFTWDLGGHVLHSHFPAFDEAIESSGVRLRTIERNGWVWIDGRLVRTPIQRHLDRMPDDLRPDAAAENLAEYYTNNFGHELYETFFGPYTLKMWATPLERIAHDWTSLRSGSGERNVPSLGLASEFVAPTDRFPYPAGGTGALWNALYRKRLDPNRIVFGRRIADVDLREHIAVTQDGALIRYQHCISSAPILEALAWTGLAAPGTAPTGLVASTVHLVGLGFVGRPPEPLADKTWLYSPDVDVPWYRATMLSNYDPGNAGPGRWNILCESSTSADRPVTLPLAVRQTCASLARLGVDMRTACSVWRRTVPMGYPVPTIGRDDAIRRIDDVLLRYDVHSRGRFGGWRYESCNQDFSFVQGEQAVDNAVFGTPEDVFWHPERF